MTEVPMEYLKGSGDGRLSFEEIDQRYRLKTRAMIGLCMPPVFIGMERGLNMLTARAQGIVPIMFYLRFETLPQPLAFGGRVETAHRVRLRRSVTPATADQAEVQRLMLDMEIDIQAQEGSGDPRSLGSGPRSKRLVPAGRMHGLHVLTRPVAPPGQRQVVDVPEPLRVLQEHPWLEPFPTVEALQDAPAGYREHETGPWQEQRSVWGLHNTDINQHVNVNEYIYSLENHFSRMLFGAGLAVKRHRMERMSILFRKPFFGGDLHGVRGRLFTDGTRTLLLGGCYRAEPEGGLDARPSVFARIEGVLEDAESDRPAH